MEICEVCGRNTPIEDLSQENNIKQCLDCYIISKYFDKEWGEPDNTASEEQLNHSNFCNEV